MKELTDLQLSADFQTVLTFAFGRHDEINHVPLCRKPISHHITTPTPCLIFTMVTVDIVCAAIPCRCHSRCLTQCIIVDTVITAMVAVSSRTITSLKTALIQFHWNEKGKHYAGHTSEKKQRKDWDRHFEVLLRLFMYEDEAPIFISVLKVTGSIPA